MLGIRALTRTLRGSPTTQSLLNALAPAAGSKTQQGSQFEYKSLLDNYSPASHFSFAANFGPSCDDQQKNAQPSRQLHAQTPPHFADEKSSIQQPRMQSSPKGASTLVDADPAGGGGYAALAVAHASLAATCFIAPSAVANAFFPGVALPEGMQSQLLVKILGLGLATGAASSWGLKQACDNDALSSPAAQRLQLGLMGFSAAAIGVHLLYSPSITMTSLLSGAVVMGTTFAIPFQSYRRAVGNIGITDVIGRYVGAVPDHLRITGLQSGLYSLLTPTLAVAGLSYLFAPGYTLGAAFGYAKDPASFFLWQNVGGGLATIAPALTYTLKKQADEGRLGDSISKTLNFGLCAASAGHLAMLTPMLMAGQGGPLLPWLVGAWGTGLAAGLAGFMGASRRG